MSRVVLCTRHWGGLGLALLMARQGSDVVCAFDYAGVTGKDLAATEKIGDGLVERQPLARALQDRDRDTLFVFDGNDLAPQAHELRDRGALVIGTSALSKRMEDDRDVAGEVAQSLGFALPETQEFTDYRKGAEFLKQNADRGFVFKPDKQDPTATYVPLQTDDPTRANEEVRRYLESQPPSHAAKFVLQEQVQGIELNLELWLAHGQALAAFCDLEAKRRLTGELGSLCGCAGGAVFQVPVEHPLVRATVGRYRDWPALADYTGSVDANVMLAGGQAYFLENCFRFGYNAYPTLFQSLATAPMEALLRGWVDGDPNVATGFDAGIGASLTIMVDAPTMGLPISVPDHLTDATYLYRAYEDDTGLHVVDQWAEVACVTALGETIPEAQALCLEEAAQIGIPGKGYRTDLGDTMPETLPAARYHALAAYGLHAGLVQTEQPA